MKTNHWFVNIKIIISVEIRFAKYVQDSLVKSIINFKWTVFTEIYCEQVVLSGNIQFSVYQTKYLHVLNCNYNATIHKTTD